MFICQSCDNDYSTNELIRYVKHYQYKDAVTGKIKSGFSKAKFICSGCFYGYTGKEYDFNYHDSEKFDEEMDKKYHQYVVYMKKRLRLVQPMKN